MSTPASFGTTISSGIQDISAILSLLGTEQCEVHVGSALRGEKRGGYLYAAVAPLSIFGSLGVAKAAFTIMLLGIPRVGGKILQQMGFEAKGDVLSLLMPVTGNRGYEAEIRLPGLLQRHHLGPSAHRIRVERPLTSTRLPIGPWNLKLLGTSALVACLGATPYLHFTVLHHTSFPALGIFFPICRVVGGLLCVFPGQLLLQYRIQMILRQRILFTGIDDLLNHEGLKLSTLYIEWHERYGSEASLWSLYEYLQMCVDDEEDAKPFLKVFTRVLRVLNPDLATGERPDARTIAWQLEPYLRNISAWALLQSLLLMGFVMTLVGYVGCFTIIQNSPNSIDTYIWLSAEAFLALIRLLVWAANPSWDDESEGVRLAVDLSEPEPLPVVKCDTNLEYSTFEIMSSGKFWETLVAHSGAMDIDETAIIRGFSAWYSWIKNGEDVEKLSIILQDERTDGWTISCTMNGQNLEFHHVELSSDDGTLTAKQTNRLEEDHALMKLSDFVMDVFDQYRLILEVKKSNSRAIHVSWPLSQSWVVTPRIESPGRGYKIRSGMPYFSAILGQGDPNPSDPEDGSALPAAPWDDFRNVVEDVMAGKILTYNDFDRFVSFVSANSGSRDLYEKLSMFLFEHTSRIHEKLRATNMNLGKQYEEQWQIYSNATSVLHRLFKPLDVGLFKRVWFRGGLEPVQIMALKKWKTNVVNRLSDRVGSTAQQATKKALASLAPPRPELNKPTGSDDAVKLWPIQASIPIQRKSLSEFCREYQISDIIMDSLFDYGLQSANGLFYLNIRDLEDAGLKRGHIAELQRAMGEFVSEYRTESGSDLGSISYSGGKKE